MYFSRIDEKFLGSTFTNSVQSQTIKITPKATTPEEKEKILKRIEAIKKEILSEINDPDRAIQLRSELYDLEKQIEEPKE
jgi:formiminotetrahydrofolate cyclodeaminase